MLKMTITEMEKDQWLSGLGREEGRVGYDYRRDIEGILVMGLFCILTADSHVRKLPRSKHT